MQMYGLIDVDVTKRTRKGHENVATTQVYIHADLALKERAIARTALRSCTSIRLTTSRSIRTPSILSAALRFNSGSTPHRVAKLSRIWGTPRLHGPWHVSFGQHRQPGSLMLARLSLRRLRPR